MIKNKNILILHGWESNSREHWFLKAKEKFEGIGYKVIVPDMPGAYFPKKDEWVKIIKDLKPDEKWILIGHSLGGVAILRYLEIAKKPVSKAMLIATPFDQMKFNPIANFFDKDFNWKKIQQNANKIIIVNEDEDPVVPLDHGIKYSQKLKSEFIIKKGCTHCDFLDMNWLEKIIET